MLWILLTVIVGAAILGSLLALCYRLMLGATARAIESRHRVIQWIVETHRPPEAWIRRKRRPRAAKRRCQRGLTDLIAYAQTSPVIADEATRQTLLRALQTVKEEWGKLDDSAFVDHDAPYEGPESSPR